MFTFVKAGKRSLVKLSLHQNPFDFLRGTLAGGESLVFYEHQFGQHIVQSNEEFLAAVQKYKNDLVLFTKKSEEDTQALKQQITNLRSQLAKKDESINKQQKIEINTKAVIQQTPKPQARKEVESQVEEQIELQIQIKFQPQRQQNAATGFQNQVIGSMMIQCDQSSYSAPKFDKPKAQTQLKRTQSKNIQPKKTQPKKTQLKRTQSKPDPPKQPSPAKPPSEKIISKGSFDKGKQTKKEAALPVIQKRSSYVQQKEISQKRVTANGVQYASEREMHKLFGRQPKLQNLGTALPAKFYQALKDKKQFLNLERLQKEPSMLKSEWHKLYSFLTKQNQTK